MSIEEKIDYYYNELLNTRNNFREISDIDDISNDKFDIKEALRKVVELNLDHLLTPSFNYYLITNSIKEGHGYNFSGMLYQKLLFIIYPETCFYLLPQYISFITTGPSNPQVYAIDKDGEVIRPTSHHSNA